MTRQPFGGLNKPGWSLHDLQGNPEHGLMESLISEYTDVSGIEVKYYIRSADASYDPLYGEDDSIEFDSYKETKILYDIDQEPSIMTAFGIYGEDTITIQMPKSIYYRDVSKTVEPSPGDIINIKWNNRNFEIANVDDDDKVFQLKRFIWLMVLKPYRFSEQSDTASEISLSKPVSAYGDNEWLEAQSEKIDDYDDVDTSIYGF